MASDNDRSPASAQDSLAEPTEQAEFLYSGQQAEVVPRALLLDWRLSPLERNAWQVIRLLSGERTLGAPRYSDLQTYLANLPYGTSSRGTVARALTVLRLTGWLSLVPRARDPHSGRLRGALYVLHEEPLSPTEALELDPAYIDLLTHSLRHTNKAVRTVAAQIAGEAAREPHGKLPPIDSHTLTTPAAGIDSARRGAEAGITDPVRMRANPGTGFETGGTAPVRSSNSPGTNRASSRNTGPSGRVSDSHQAPTVRTYTDTCIKTVPRARSAELVWPPALSLSSKARQQATQALQTIDPALRQAVLDEAGARCADGGIRTPAAYLMGLIRRALRGDFNPTVTSTEPSPFTPAAEAAPVRPPKRHPGDPISAEVQACLKELRSFGRTKGSG